MEVRAPGDARLLSDNSFETTAYCVKALAPLDPKSELLPKAARWLIDRRTGGYYWDSTEQTATAIYGLIDYLKVSGELEAQLHAHGFRQRQESRGTADDRKGRRQSAALVVTLNAPEVHAGANEVRLVKTGPGVLYWSARSHLLFARA